MKPQDVSGYVRKVYYYREKKIMIIRNEKIITILAIINVLIIAFFSFLTVIMYNNSIGQMEHIAENIILICALGSVITKLIMKKNWYIILSIIFDFILVIFLYNVTDYDSLQKFMQSLLSVETHLVCFLYLYLVFYYTIILRKWRNAIA